MEAWNQNLFLIMNAPAQPSAFMLGMGVFFAEYVIWLVPSLLIVGWLRGAENTKKLMLEAALVGVIALFVSAVIGMLWPHPRPFMIGLGHTLIPHAADTSFPSDHMTLMWSVAFSLLLNQRTRMLGCGLAVLGLAVAWARIYLGVHSPIDMVGAAMVAIVCATLGLMLKKTVFEFLYVWIAKIYRVLFAPLIRMGWVR